MTITIKEYFIEKKTINENVINDILKKTDCNCLDLVNDGIWLRDNGYTEFAIALFNKANNENPHLNYPLYELAFLYLINKKPLLGYEAIKKSMAVNPHDTRIMALAIRLLTSLSWSYEIDKLLQSYFELTNGDSSYYWMKEIAEFVSLYHIDYIVYLCDSIKNRGFCHAREVSDLIFNALNNKTGFSLIRLGDGEGAFLNHSIEDEDKFKNLYDYSRKDRSYVWFKDELDIETSGFTKEMSNLNKIILDCDVIGIPYASRLMHEYLISSPAGVSSLVNIILLLNQKQFIDSIINYSSQDIHIELMRSGELEKIIKSQKKISIISCHSSLPDILKNKFNLDEVTFYKIPGEKAHASIIGSGATEGQHFPDRFHDIMQQLDNTDLSGELFLVAGGILGKFYCDQIKQSNGVAVDIGSVADNWLGLATRPTIAENDKLNVNA